MLTAAKDWGVPPWEIAPDAMNKRDWFYRWIDYQTEVTRPPKSKK